MSATYKLAAKLSGEHRASKPNFCTTKIVKIQLLLSFHLYWQEFQLLRKNYVTLKSHKVGAVLACEQALRGALAARREKEGELATTSLEFEYLHRKRRFKMLIGGHDLSKEVITMGTCCSMFVFILTRFRFSMIGENLTTRSTGSHREIWGGLQIPETQLRAPGELARWLEQLTTGSPHFAVCSSIIEFAVSTLHLSPSIVLLWEFEHSLLEQVHSHLVRLHLEQTLWQVLEWFSVVVVVFVLYFPPRRLRRKGRLRRRGGLILRGVRGLRILRGLRRLSTRLCPRCLPRPPRRRAR